jgi:hypothetical protein
MRYFCASSSQRIGLNIASLGSSLMAVEEVGYLQDQHNKVFLEVVGRVAECQVFHMHYQIQTFVVILPT